MGKYNVTVPALDEKKLEQDMFNDLVALIRSYAEETSEPFDMSARRVFRILRDRIGP